MILTAWLYLGNKLDGFYDLAASTIEEAREIILADMLNGANGCMPHSRVRLTCQNFGRRGGYTFSTLSWFYRV
jgi:hypothetical protein